MRLKTITEGISYRPGSEFDIAQVQEQLRDKGGNQIGLMQYLEGNGTFVFHPEDSPNDIIKIEPFQKSVYLNMAPTDPEALESFQGVKVYYAYRVADAQEIDLDFYKAGENPIKKATEELKKMAEKPDDLLDPTYLELILTTSNTIKFLINKKSDLGKVLTPKHSLYYNDAAREKEHTAIKKKINTINAVIKLLNDYGLESVEQLKTKLRGSDRQHNSGKSKLLPALKNALGHIIKHPRNPNERELRATILDEIIKKINVVGQWGEGHDVFPDVIAYPTSTIRDGETQSFNQELANRLSEAHGGVPVIEIAKRPRGDTDDYFESTINRNALRREATHLLKRLKSKKDANQNVGNLVEKMTITPEKHRKYLPDLNEIVDPLVHPEWVDLWVAKEYAKIREALEGTPVGQNPTYKSLARRSGSMGSKRRFVQLFGKGTGESQYSSEDQLRGKNLMIVDDNIQYGGTIETLHQLVNEASPQSVTVFVPFYLGNL